MKRFATTVLFFLLVVPALSAAETQRYVVVTRRAAPLQRATQMVSDVAQPTAAPEARELDTFAALPGFSADLTADEAAALRLNPEVKMVEPVAERHALDVLRYTVPLDVARNPFAQVVPLGVDAVHARDVWPATRGENTNVVVVDTGIDYTHPDLAPEYVGGYNTLTKTNDPRDDNGHGSHVSGTIAAADNDIGVVGIVPRVRLWAVKVLDKNGNGNTGNEIAALQWIIDRKHELGGNWVVNLSLGSSTANDAEKTMFAKAIDEGLLICAATGNESGPVDYPAAYPNVLAVGAVDATQKIASFSNQGPEVSVVGPGVNVLSTVPVGTATTPAATITSSLGNFSGVGLSGGKKGAISGRFVYCGLGNPNEFPASVAGNIALIQRGTLKFAEKTRNAVNAGATAVVIFNNDTSALNFTLVSDAAEDAWTKTFDWPITVAISNTDGQTLANAKSGDMNVECKADDYEVMSGTSMATPHATGVAALVWSAAPSATADAVRSAITRTADDLGTPGFDTTYGWGELNALNAAKDLNPSLFAAPVTPANPGPHPGRKNIHRGRR